MIDALSAALCALAATASIYGVYREFSLRKPVLCARCQGRLDQPGKLSLAVRKGQIFPSDD